MGFGSALGGALKGMGKAVGTVAGGLAGMSGGKPPVQAPRPMDEKPRPTSGIMSSKRVNRAIAGRRR